MFPAGGASEAATAATEGATIADVRSAHDFLVSEVDARVSQPKEERPHTIVSEMITARISLVGTTDQHSQAHSHSRIIQSEIHRSIVDGH